MGLFGFGRKKHRKDDDVDVDNDNEDAKETTDAADDAATDAKDADTKNTGAKDTDAKHTDAKAGKAEDDEAREPAFPEEPVESYDERGELYGPWDIDEENGPDYDEYLDMGAYYLPFLKGIELRVKASRSSGQILGCTISYKSSSLEVEAFAAPKTLGLWDDMRDDLLASKGDASEHAGVFGMEVRLPVKVKGGKSVTTRIVGVDGPRWMLRGIFSGRAATQPKSPETKALDRFFSQIVVDRGEEPLAPRDLIAMHAPVSPEQRRKADEAAEEADGDDKNGNEIPKRVKGPFVADQQTEVQTTISRGPMFSELR
ncbi:DUF3710 domain-containing protein [Bifidobacterium sp. ESL0763]|uniref:DUF3710 domain-containing protein n=1 Tax=Bifidobacterium sp. ESL0763 TaxID=2983227 RepID=UPI0023F6547D|nr:DUF3710 domain-containing protein [Bifidobacterium sp. ESL0763]MDF7664098.1 DUF3710 domain-containing protein [Bifidobacterium sp. ESL0763]